jgi:hypothetical protein
MFATAAIFFVACGETTVPENTGNTANDNANAATAPAADPKAAVVEMETRAHEAWKAKDGKFFEGMLADNFTSIGMYTDKASLVKSISESPCDVKDVKLEDAQTVNLSDSAVLVTEKVVADYTCGGKPGLSPTWAASLYIKSGDDWKAAFHQGVPAADAKGEAAPVPAASKTNGDDDLTKSLSEMDKNAWDAWSKKESKFFEDWASAGYVSLDSDGRTDKAKLVKEISESPCEVKGFSMEGFKAVQISDDLAILTYTASQDGKCGETVLPKNVFASTIYVKDGGAWKGAFHIETPAS